MIADVVDLLTCPRCAAPLHLPASGALGCGNGHRFDLARQGHANLLTRPAPVNADSAAMVGARLRHLARGHHYAIRQHLVQRSGDTVLDAGCGPGWYVGALPHDTRIVGLDLSVAAVRRAAKVHPRVGALVTDLRHRWPVVDGGVETVWSVFAPRTVTEFVRVLRPGGTGLVVLPAPDHLAELVAAGVVIGQLPDKEDRLLEQFADGFEPIDRQVSRTVVEATPDLVADIVAMGPSAHHREPVGPTRSTGALSESVTVSLVLREFRRR